jgi:hypothetical protein
MGIEIAAQRRSAGALCDQAVVQDNGLAGVDGCDLHARFGGERPAGVEIKIRRSVV